MSQPNPPEAAARETPPSSEVSISTSSNSVLQFKCKIRFEHNNEECGGVGIVLDADLTVNLDWPHGPHCSVIRTVRPGGVSENEAASPSEPVLATAAETVADQQPADVVEGSIIHQPDALWQENANTQLQYEAESNENEATNPSEPVLVTATETVADQQPADPLEGNIIQQPDALWQDNTDTQVHYEAENNNRAKWEEAWLQWLHTLYIGPDGNLRTVVDPPWNEEFLRYTHELLDELIQREYVTNWNEDWHSPTIAQPAETFQSNDPEQTVPEASAPTESHKRKIDSDNDTPYFCDNCQTEHKRKKTRA